MIGNQISLRTFQQTRLQDTTNTPKYLHQFLTVLLAIFTTGPIFARQSKQGVARQLMCSFGRNVTRTEVYHYRMHPEDNC